MKITTTAADARKLIDRLLQQVIYDISNGQSAIEEIGKRVAAAEKEPDKQRHMELLRASVAGVESAKVRGHSLRALSMLLGYLPDNSAIELDDTNVQAFCQMLRKKEG